MANDTWANGTVISGDAGSVAYDDTNSTGMSWFLFTATAGRRYTFVSDEPGYYFELYRGDGPQWSGLEYLKYGEDNYLDLSFSAQVDVHYSLVIWPSASATLSWTSEVVVPGWSEWFRDPDSGASGKAVYEFENLSNLAGSPASEVTTHSTPSDYFNHGAETRWGTYQGADWLGSTRGGILVVPGDSWNTPDWWPSQLWNNEQGVEFDVIPGKVLSDVDAFVQYETGDNTILGWYIPDVVTSVNQVYGINPGTTWTVELVTGLPAVAVGGVPNIPPAGSGTVLATISSAFGSTTVSGIADPGPVSSVGLFVYDPMLYPPPIDPGGGEMVAEGYAYWQYSIPSIRLRTTRYRYWIPDLGGAPVAYLWNAQRTGGGGRSAGRGRGDTTQQGSCRNRGAIH